MSDRTENTIRHALILFVFSAFTLFLLSSWCPQFDQFSSFAGLPSGLVTIVHCEEKQQL